MDASIMPSYGAGSSPLLQRGEAEPFLVDNEGGPSPFVLVCDHAGRAVPRAIDLGIGAAEMDRHIAWDIGAGDLARLLSERLDAALLRQPYSRLVVDCNRAPDRADAMPGVSDGTVVPANRALDPATRAARVAEIHEPYHARLAALLDDRIGRATALVLVHSFTPVMLGVARPWTYGVLHTGQPLALATLACLRAADIGQIGDNEPYAMDEVDYTAGRHSNAHRLDFVELEVRQDLIASATDRPAVADLLARILPQALADTRRP